MKSPLGIIEGMRCDGGSRVIIGCLAPVVYGVRIHVPSKTQDQPGHGQVRLSTALHACVEHRGTFKLDDVLTPPIKAKVEDFARKTRPLDWKPDYDAAFLQYVDIYSPEYKRFLLSLELHLAHEAEQAWGGPIAVI